MSAVSKKTIKVRGADSIILHWFNVAVWIAMLATGFGIVAGGAVRLVPKAWPEFMQGLFGGNANLALAHIAIGLIWVVVFVVYALISWRKVWSFMRSVLVLTPWQAAKDGWAMAVSLGHLFGIRLKAPEAGRFNGAQRLLGTMIVFGSLALAATGIYMYFAPKFLDFAAQPLFGLIFRWSLTVHIAAVMLVLIGLVAHIYYAVVEEGESLTGMTNGEVPVEFIHHHNPRWHAELKAEGKLPS